MRKRGDNMYRNTYVKISLNNIKRNVEKMISTFPDYQYYFAVVKADSYGHYGNRPIEKMIEAGCNYLAVSSLDEAMQIRNYFSDIPILCLEPISTEYIPVAAENNITLTISSTEIEEYLKQLPHKLKVHLKVNTGMNRLGLSTKEELSKCYNRLKQNRQIEIEGIFTHIYEATNELKTKRQFKCFEDLTTTIPLDTIPIIHITASEATELYPKLPYVNGCRFGIMMYGFSKTNKIKLDSTFTLISEVIQIQTLNKNDTVGYDAAYQATEDKERIAIVSIGYADGITRANTGRIIYINEKEYSIVGNICMDMLFVKVDEQVSVHDKVYIIKDVEHIKTIANHLHTVPQEVMCNISKRVPRVYDKEDIDEM